MTRGGGGGGGIIIAGGKVGLVRVSMGGRMVVVLGVGRDGLSDGVSLIDIA
jgi:hypothetical protein